VEYKPEEGKYNTQKLKLESSLGIVVSTELNNCFEEEIQ